MPSLLYLFLWLNLIEAQSACSREARASRCEPIKKQRARLLSARPARRVDTRFEADEPSESSAWRALSLAILTHSFPFANSIQTSIQTQSAIPKLHLALLFFVSSGQRTCTAALTNAELISISNWKVAQERRAVCCPTLYGLSSSRR